MDNHIGPLQGSIVAVEAAPRLARHRAHVARQTLRANFFAGEADRRGWRARELDDQAVSLSRCIRWKEGVQRREGKERRIKAHVAEQLRDAAFEAGVAERDAAEQQQRCLRAGAQVRRRERYLEGLCARLGVWSYEEAREVYGAVLPDL